VQQRNLSSVLFAGALLGLVAGVTIESVAMAAPPNTCVTVCEAKADTCALECMNEADQPYDACQMACARALFVACFDKCSDTGEVVADDFKIVPDDSGDDE
jgi:hypothetical protein